MPFTMAREVLDSLKNDPVITRNLYVLPGRDMVATYMKWQGEEIDYSTSIVLQKPVSINVYHSYDIKGRWLAPDRSDYQISMPGPSTTAQ